MKISLKWIQEFVEIATEIENPQLLADRLTAAGLEVESIENRKEELKNVVVGLILEKDQHPNADKLSLCRVSVGANEIHQIVCGAANHKKGDRVAVALPGAVLPGSFAIQKAKIRGVESFGMLCSEKELGLAEQSAGIMILSADAPVGSAFSHYMGLDDVVFELKVTPNRADCLSHFGLAREISCLLGRPLKKLEPSWSSEQVPSQKTTKDFIQIELKDPLACPRYAGRWISDVKIGPSPNWLRNRLESLGLNSINNIVDITNWVLMELGQPLHAFDGDSISGGKVVIEAAVKGEKFVTLDGTELEFHGGELAIRDSQRTMVLAGVIGGKGSGVSVETRNIFLECAYFSPEIIRKTAREYGIETDSSYRFSRGVDPELIPLALNRATEMILKVAGGKACNDFVDLYPSPQNKNPILLNKVTVDQRLGYQAREELLIQYLKNLGCEVQVVAPGQYQVLPPSFRVDLEMDMDLVEEYARLQGYEHIPETLPPYDQMPKREDIPYKLTRGIAHELVGLGFQEAFNFCFVSEKKEKDFWGSQEKMFENGFDLGERIRLKNPLNENLALMRSSLLPGLWENAVSNFHYGNEWGRLFEVGSVFSKSPEGYREPKRLALMAWGYPFGYFDKTKSNVPLVYYVKSSIEALLMGLGLAQVSWKQPRGDFGYAPFQHFGQTVHLIVEGVQIGVLSTINPDFVSKEKLRGEFLVAELDLDLILARLPRKLKAKSPSRYPISYRDLAFVMGSQTQIGDILKEVRKQVGEVFLDCRVFDLYTGERLEVGQKSVALRVFLQNPSGTLQDSEVDGLISKVVTTLAQQHQVNLRK